MAGQCLIAQITQIVRQEIALQGFIPFARFMELALYCPNYGYYERAETVIGQAGNYFTSVSTGSLFGQLLAFQFAEWLNQLPERPVQLVEAGAHHGSLAVDILAWLSQMRSAILESLEYWIIEPSPRRRTWQKNQLEHFAGRVSWSDSIRSLPNGVHGVIFSNELLDAMPVHRLGWDAASRLWFEWGVGVRGEEFVWAKMPMDQTRASAELKKAGLELPPALAAILPDGFAIDICPGAAEWWQQAATVLRDGKLLTIDYGLTAEQFLIPERPAGTLRAYFRHHLSTDPLGNVGEQDLTAHVNWTQLQQAGEAAGLQTVGLFTQEQFFTQIASATWKDESSFGEWTPHRVRQFQTLTHPQHLGRSFRVLVQSRSLQAPPSTLAPGANPNHYGRMQ